MNSFQKFVSEHARLLQGGRKLPLGKSKRAARRTKISPRAPKVLIFSPHPDDECIVGGLALRLLREAKRNVINVAVTLGSKRERRKARRRELQNACASLGFGLVVPGPALRDGLERINLETRRRNRVLWRVAVKVVAQILVEHQPRVIFVPHDHDGHETHIGTHFLVLDALKTLPAAFKCHVVETEFWGQMTGPNLLVESNAKDVADLVAALACHAGEVRRNAYHARLPAWMIDNVRRGAELVGGQGGAAPDFTFATIYRLRKWKGGKLQKNFRGGTFLCVENSCRLVQDLSTRRPILFHEPPERPTGFGVRQPSGALDVAATFPKAVEDHRTPRRRRADASSRRFMAPMCVQSWRSRLPKNPTVGRAVLCAPRTWKNMPLLRDGAHGVTRPTVLRFQEFNARHFVSGKSFPLGRGWGDAKQWARAINLSVFIRV